MGPRRISAPKHPPNKRLTWQRLQRGWSREELVEQIKQSMKDADEAESGLNADIVRRWETGDRKPEPRYKKHLVLIFGKPASQLGLLSEAELALCPAESTALAGERLVDAVLKKVMLVVLGGNAEFGRHLFLKGLLGASLAPLVAEGAAIPDTATALADRQRTRLDPRAIDAFAAITTSHRDLYWRRPAIELLPSAAAHVHLGDVMLTSASDTETPVARRLAAAVAESALLVARLALFDLDRPHEAEPFFQLAEDAAEAAHDHDLSAAVLAHRAFVPGFAQHNQPAREFLNSAHAHARYGAGSLLRSWLHCVDAEISARTGRSKASIARIRSAEDALATAGTDMDPLWLDYFDASRLDGFAGNTLLLAGQHRLAATRLEQAVNGLAEAATKQQAVLLFDLATAQAPADTDQALATAQRACDIVGHSPYAAALQRVPHVLAAFGATPHAHELSERVHALTNAGGAV